MVCKLLILGCRLLIPDRLLATWTEIDTAGRVWTISAARMKAKREHLVPLCGRALEILDAARTLGDGSPLVFPMRSGRPISTSTLPKMLQYHRIAAVAHGFRSPFRDRAADDTDHPREVIEAALYEEPCRWLKERAHPIRQQNFIEANRVYWYRHRRPVPDMWRAIDGMSCREAPSVRLV